MYFADKQKQVTYDSVETNQNGMVKYLRLIKSR